MISSLILNGTDQSEKTAALVDLVENGANLLRAVDCLLRDIHTLSGVSGEYTLSESCCGVLKGTYLNISYCCATPPPCFFQLP